ncbi:MAG: MFS transporter, partial [Candidatus Omnitrophica bacterium]|nr:MFS transporter [Candidatus Omnitrophota bacterium]
AYDQFDFSQGSYTFKYDDQKKINAKAYLEQKASKPANWEDSDWTAKIGNLRFEKISEQDDSEKDILVYDVKDTRANHKGITEKAVRTDGRLYYEIYDGKLGKDNKKKLYFGRLQLPLKTYKLTSWKGSISLDEEIPYMEHYIIFTEGVPQQMWVFNRNIGEGERAEIYRQLDTFINGKPVSKESGRVSVRTEKEIKQIQRDGRYFYNGELKHEREDRFTPKVHREYTAQGMQKVQEYTRIQFSEHNGNNWGHNLFTEAAERGTLKPLTIVVGVGIAVITLAVPLILVAVTAFIGFALYNKLGKKVNISNSQASGNTKTTDQQTQKLRQRIASINRHLYLSGPFTEYLLDIYGKGLKNIGSLINDYYPKASTKDDKDHPYRETVLDEVEDWWSKSEEEKLVFIEKYFISPITAVWLTLLIDQLERWTNYNKGKREKARLEGSFPFTDVDLRRLFELYYQKEGQDPTTKFNLNKYFPDIAASQATPPLVEQENGKYKISKYVNHEVLDEIRNALKDAEEKSGWEHPIYPYKVNKSLKIIYALFVAGGSYVVAHAMLSGLPAWGIGFIAFIWGFIIYDTYKILPYIQYQKYYLGLIKKALTSDYKYDSSAEAIKIKKSFFVRYLATVVTINVLIVAAALFYASGTLPLFALIGAGLPLFLIGVRESFKSLWSLFVEAAATRVYKNRNYVTLYSYQQIGKKQLDRIREISGDKGNVLLEKKYLADVFKEVVIKGTLLRFHLVDASEAEALERIVQEDKDINSLPELKEAEAKKVIINFFNKIEMFKQGELGNKLSNMRDNKKELLPVIFKGTGKKRCVPTREFLDGEDAAGEPETTGVVKSGFYIVKEQFNESWKIFLRNLLMHQSSSQKDELIKKLAKPKVTLEATIDKLVKEGITIEDDKSTRITWDKQEIEHTLIHQWILFRSDGFLKTQILSEESGEWAYRILLRHIGVSEDQMYKYVRLIFGYEKFEDPADPTKPQKEGTGELFEELSKRGWIYNGIQEDGKPGDGNKIMCSTYTPREGQYTDESYIYPYELESKWKQKVNYWSVTGRFIEQFLYESGKDDAVILNSDRDHFFYPSDFFMMPFIAQRFTNEQNLGWMTTDLRVFVDGFTPAASDHRVAEDNWNTRILAVEPLIGTNAFYGPGIVRWQVMRNWGCYMDNIEDTGGALEAFLEGKGWRPDYSNWISWGRPREMLLGSMPAFQNRFGGLVLDRELSVEFQKTMESDELHWTEKLTLLQNFDHYVNKPIIPRYNLLVFLTALFISFSPYAYLAAPLFFISFQYVLSQAITAGGIRLFINQPKPSLDNKRALSIAAIAGLGLSSAIASFVWFFIPQLWPAVLTFVIVVSVYSILAATGKRYFKLANWITGYAMYLKRFWSLVFTFLPFIPMHDEKVRGAFEGTGGLFTSGIKDLVYPQLIFDNLYQVFKPAILWGVILFGILYLSSAHPFGVIGQLFFYVFPFAFVFGPFMKNGRTNRAVISGIWVSLVALGVLSFTSFSLLWGILPFAVFSFLGAVKAAIQQKDATQFYHYLASDRFIRGVAQGLFALLYGAVEISLTVLTLPIAVLRGLWLKLKQQGVIKAEDFAGLKIDAQKLLDNLKQNGYLYEENEENKVQKKFKELNSYRELTFSDYEQFREEIYIILERLSKGFFKKGFDSIAKNDFMSWLEKMPIKTKLKEGKIDKHEMTTLDSFYEGIKGVFSGKYVKWQPVFNETQVKTAKTASRLYTVTQVVLAVALTTGLLPLMPTVYIMVISGLIFVVYNSAVRFYKAGYENTYEKLEEVGIGEAFRLSLSYSFVAPVYGLFADIIPSLFNSIQKFLSNKYSKSENQQSKTNNHQNTNNNSSSSLTSDFNRCLKQAVTELEAIEQEAKNFFEGKGLVLSEETKGIVDTRKGKANNLIAEFKELAKQATDADTKDYLRELSLRATIARDEDVSSMTRYQQVSVIPYGYVYNRRVGASPRQYPSFNQQIYRSLGYAMTEAENPPASRQGPHMHPGNTERTFSGSDNTQYIDYNSLINELAEKYNFGDDLKQIILADHLYKLDQYTKQQEGSAKSEEIFNAYLKREGLDLSDTQVQTLKDIYLKEDILKLENKYAHTVPFGHIVQTPAGYSHTLRNSSFNVPSIDWTFKDLFLQLFKVAGGKTVGGQFQIKHPMQTGKEGSYNIYSHTLEGLTSEVKTDAQGRLLFAKDAQEEHN